MHNILISFSKNIFEIHKSTLPVYYLCFVSQPEKPATIGQNIFKYFSQPNLKIKLNSVSPSFYVEFKVKGKGIHSHFKHQCN